jgi:hypothetical protein
MISKKKMALGLAGVASMLVMGATALGANPASAEAGGCVVTTGSVHTNSPITATSGSNGGAFTSTNITCVSSGAASGNWTGLGATFTSNAGGNCATESGGGSFTGGSDPSGGNVSGSFTFTRAGANVKVSGTLNGHGFTAALLFVPAGTQNCVTGVTDASLNGAVAITS